MIEIKGLIKTYDRRGQEPVEALTGVDLTIEEGEIFGVIGLSGAGKSTLIRCLNLLEVPSGGSVVVDGRDLSTLSRSELLHFRRGMGMIFQSFNLLSSRTVSANVAFPLEVAGLAKSEIRRKVGELLELVGLSDKADAYPAQLSGGQKQRIGIARALANNPKILLCDEATSSLDPQTTSSILRLIEDLKKRLGLTVVLITHEMKVITEICDRVAVMESGRIIEVGRVMDVFMSPKHPTTQSFVEVERSSKEASFCQDFQPQGKLVKVYFVGESVAEPLVYTLVKRYGVVLNILQANIDNMNGTPFGAMIFDLSGAPEDVEKSLQYMRESGHKAEVIKC
ncbi:MAG: methionine ABC transporter ATP-binding protein [Deltaproteobacteria bacterium]|nr:methionine ABC transporter ATP-binding protein [Deltaproteobacteria bacterium]